MKIHPVFHSSLLEPYKTSNEPLRPEIVPPLPKVIDGVEEYEVESILNHRENRGKLEYFVHWKGYPETERTWEPANQLTHCKRLIALYRNGTSK